MSNKLLGGIVALIILAILVGITLRDQQRLIAFDKQTGALLDAVDRDIAAAAADPTQADKFLADLPSFTERAAKLPAANSGYRKKLRADIVGIFAQIGEYAKSHPVDVHAKNFYTERIKTVFDGLQKRLKEGEEEESGHKD